MEKINIILGKIITGMLLGFGFLFTIGIFLFASWIIYPYLYKTSAADFLYGYFINREVEYKLAKPTEPIYFEQKEIQTNKIAKDKEIVFIKNVDDIKNALENYPSGNIELVFYPGQYNIKKTVEISQNGVSIRSLERSPKSVIFSGDGLSGTVGNLFRVSGSDFSIEYVTLESASLHLLQIAGESNSSNIFINNCVFRDSKQQFIKISYDLQQPNKYSSNGIIKNSYFYFSGGMADHFYTGGIDGHAVRNWIIENNIFKDISSPGEHIAEHAIHLWNNSAYNIVRGNIILNSDRGIGFGLSYPKHRNIIYSNLGGLIENNYIFSKKNENPFSDVGIVLESSPKTIIKDNYIFLENSYPRAIEYRYKMTKDVEIENNYTNKSISSRDYGHAIKSENDEALDKKYFLNKVLMQLQLIPIDDEYKEEIRGFLND